VGDLQGILDVDTGEHGPPAIHRLHDASFLVLILPYAPCP
jgi:hypothetical protein